MDLDRKASGCRVNGMGKEIRGVLNTLNQKEVNWDKDGIRLRPNVAKYRIDFIHEQLTIFGQRIKLREVECVCGGLIYEFDHGQNECPECNRWLVTITSNNDPENP